MSVLPLLLSITEDLNDFTERNHDNNFGFGLHPQEIYRIQKTPRLYIPRHRSSPYQLIRQHLSEKDKEKTDLTTVGKDGFQACMDVAQFKPSELTVKTVDNTVVVEGKHEEREDEHGFISRHFLRKYKLPKGYDPKEVVSTLSSDGVLTVKAPPPPSKKQKENERIIQIQQTGPAHLTVKENETSAENNSNSHGTDGNTENMED